MSVKFKPETTGAELIQIGKNFGLRNITVVMKDQLKDLHLGRKYIIINMASSSDPRGTHWVALYRDKENVYHYFDSFGQPPLLEVMEYVARDKKNKGLYFNKIQFQSINTGYCGEYAVWFLYTKKHDLALEDLLKVIRVFP